LARPEDPEPGLPIKLDRCSNGEFVPPPLSSLVVEAQRRTRDGIERASRHIGMSRRSFLTTMGASAVALLALDACSEDEASSRGERPGGRYSVPPEATTEPTLATDALGGNEFVMDVQGHLLDFDLTDATGRTDRGFWRGYPQASCGDDDPRSCFSVEHFMEEIFLKSDTSLVVLSAIPLTGPDNPLSIEVMERTRRIARVLCHDDRVLLHGQASPSFGSLDAALADMGTLVAEHPIKAWKTYTHAGGPGWFLDDHDPDDPGVGEAFLRRAVELDRPIVCVHKGLSGGDPHASPVDIGPAAARHRDLAFVVYHSGFEIGVTEGPFDPQAPNGGVDRLVASLRSSAIGAGANVYAELGSTWRALMGRPTEAAHVLGKLLLAVGEDRICWGTDSIWYGSPQDQIQAFRAFSISPELQERHGYPALTTARKAKILGLNAARLYEVEPDAVPCPFSRQDLQAAREAAPASFRVWGPTSRAEVRAHVAAHGGLA